MLSGAKRTSACAPLGGRLCAISRSPPGRKVLGYSHCTSVVPRGGTCNDASSSRFSVARRQLGRLRCARAVGPAGDRVSSCAPSASAFTPLVAAFHDGLRRSRLCRGPGMSPWNTAGRRAIR